jgi:plastocyanin
MRRPALIRCLLTLVAAAVLAAARGAVAAAGAEELRVHVQLLAKGGKGPARGSEVRQAIVYYDPAVAPAVKPSPVPFVMTTRRKEFDPRILVIPRGSRVRFPNEDPILHNVFSVSGQNQFDLGLYKGAPGKEKRFDQPGVVRVYCNVHHDMVAYLLVLATPYHGAPDANGDLVLSGLPRGAGKLSVWHEQTELRTVDVELPQLPQKGAPLTIGLEVVRPLIPSHLNKSGESYFRARGDRYDNR